jgi:predicted nucleic acid-binding Zn finger protein
MPPNRCGRRLCRFTENLQSEFTFLKKVRNDNDYNVYCTICSSSFSVSHGGRSDITDHLKTNKHKTAKQAGTFSSVSNYFTPLKADDNALKLAAKEVTFVYHTISHSQSFNSMTCTSTLIRKLFDEKNVQLLELKLEKLL